MLCCPVVFTINSNNYILIDYALNETSIYFNFLLREYQQFSTQETGTVHSTAVPIYQRGKKDDRNTGTQCSGKMAYSTVRVKAGFQIFMWLEKTHLFLVRLLNLSLSTMWRNIIIRANYITLSSLTPSEWNISSINVNYFPVSIIALQGVGRILIPTLQLL